MSLPSVTSLKNDILALSPTTNQVQGVTDFVNVVANFTNQVQAGSGGTPGILIFGNTAMISILLTQVPVSDNSWISTFVNAWQAGITTSVITPSTVTNAAWTGSGNKDTNTSPSAATTIPTIAAAAAVLTAQLANVVPDSTAPLALAQALSDATLALSFICIGLGPGPSFTPIPITFPAQ